MLKESFTHVVKWAVLSILFTGSVFLAYHVGRVRERRIAEPIIEGLQIHAACLEHVNKTYRRELNDIGGGWCSEKEIENDR